MAKATALTLAEEEVVIKNRFLTQTTVTRGEPPFRKLTKRSALPNLCKPITGLDVVLPLNVPQVSAAVRGDRAWNAGDHRESF